METNDGTGIYRVFGWDMSEETHGLGRQHTERHPGARDEKWATKHGTVPAQLWDRNYAIGCPGRNAFYRWFTPSTIKKISACLEDIRYEVRHERYRNGVFVRVFNVEHYFITESKRQCLFFRRGAKWLKQINVHDLAKRFDR